MEHNANTQSLKKYLVILLLFPSVCLFSQNADVRILRDINQNQKPHLTGILKVITTTAAPVAFGLPAVLVCLALWRKKKPGLKDATFISLTVVSSALIDLALKYGINRPRPFITYSFIEKLSSGGSPSFPSGHTTNAFAVATAVSLAYPKWYVILPAYAWAAAVGYSRIYLGVHYPSDVLMGAMIGAGSALLFYQMIRKSAHSSARKNSNPDQH